MMIRRHFIKLTALVSLAPFAVEAVLAEFIAVCVLLLGILAIIALAMLCKKKLANPPKPPPDTDNTSTQSGKTETFPSLNPPLESLWEIDPLYQDPNGNYFTHVCMVDIQTSTDLSNWTKCGSVVVWFNDTTAVVQQSDTNGNVLKVTTTGTQANFSLAGIGLEDATQRFFTMTATPTNS
jgi:hypothetical protein